MIEVLVLILLCSISFVLGGRYCMHRQAQERRQWREMQVRQEYIDELKGARDSRPFDWSTDL